MKRGIFTVVVFLAITPQGCGRKAIAGLSPAP